MANSWAKHRMRENRNNQYRPEQLVFAKSLRVIRPKSIIHTEYVIDYNYDNEIRHAIVDVIDLTSKEIFRINGGYHLASSRQTIKDEIQKAGLETMGYKVIDINSDEIV